MTIKPRDLEQRLWAAANALARTYRPRRLQDIRLLDAVLEVDQRHVGYEHAQAVEDYGDDLTDEIEADYGHQIAVAFRKIAQAPQTRRGLRSVPWLSICRCVPRPCVPKTSGGQEVNSG